LTQQTHEHSKPLLRNHYPPIPAKHDDARPLIYALHAFSALTGLASSVLVLTAFLTAGRRHRVILNTRSARGAMTWLDSHFGWQIRTFWYALLWLLLAGGVVTMVGIRWRSRCGCDGVWVLYRIARGWMTLSSEKPMPPAGAG